MRLKNGDGTATWRRVYTALAGVAGGIAVLVSMTVITRESWPVELVAWILFPFTWLLVVASALATALTGSFLGNTIALFTAPLIAGVIFGLAGNLQFRIVAWLVQAFRSRWRRSQNVGAAASDARPDDGRPETSPKD